MRVFLLLLRSDPTLVWCLQIRGRIPKSDRWSFEFVCRKKRIKLLSGSEVSYDANFGDGILKHLPNLRELANGREGGFFLRQKPLGIPG